MVDMSPCKGCERRKLGCHDECDAYRRASEERERIKTAEREFKALYWAGVRRTRKRRYG